jgi:hypothetical protein
MRSMCHFSWTSRNPLFVTVEQVFIYALSALPFSSQIGHPKKGSGTTRRGRRSISKTGWTITIIILILSVAVGECFISTGSGGDTDVTSVRLRFIEDDPVLQIDRFAPTISTCFLRTYSSSFTSSLCVYVSCACVLSAWLSARSVRPSLAFTNFMEAHRSTA